MHTRGCACNAHTVDVPTRSLGAHSHVTLLLCNTAPTGKVHTRPPPRNSSRRHATDRQDGQSSQRAKQVCSVTSCRQGGPAQEKPVQSCHCCNTAEARGGLCCADAQKGSVPVRRCAAKPAASPKTAKQRSKFMAKTHVKCPLSKEVEGGSKHAMLSVHSSAVPSKPPTQVGKR